MLKLKNTKKTPFSFEGTQIEPGQSKEVDSAIAQKLLALYWHNGLEIDETPTQKQVGEEIAPGDKVECPYCKRMFASTRAMKTHQQLSGCKKLKQTNGNS